MLFFSIFVSFLSLLPPDVSVSVCKHETREPCLSVRVNNLLHNDLVNTQHAYIMTANSIKGTMRAEHIVDNDELHLHDAMSREKGVRAILAI